jgi:hypothetical protein
VVGRSRFTSGSLLGRPYFGSLTVHYRPTSAHFGPLLCHTPCFGGFSPDVVHLMRDLAEERQNRLNKAEYELTTWAARTWLSFSAQKISVALHRAASLEIAHALGLSTGADER